MNVRAAVVMDGATDRCANRGSGRATIRRQGQRTIKDTGAMGDMTPAAKFPGPRFPTPAIEAGLLVMIAGYADAIGFLQFRAFAGQITGNTILLAISIVEASCAWGPYY